MVIDQREMSQEIGYLTNPSDLFGILGAATKRVNPTLKRFETATIVKPELNYSRRGTKIYLIPILSVTRMKELDHPSRR